MFGKTETNSFIHSDLERKFILFKNSLNRNRVWFSYKTQTESLCKTAYRRSTQHKIRDFSLLQSLLAILCWILICFISAIALFCFHKNFIKFYFNFIRIILYLYKNNTKNKSKLFFIKYSEW